jgi:peptidoglycan biosynthesis protein MviN/MurJ (putative lipid II flippase)
VAVNLLLNIFLVPHYGLMASSVSLLVASLLYAGFVAFLALRAGGQFGTPSK